MSRSIAISAVALDHSAILPGLLSFYRRWFANETVHNPRALHEIGLSRAIINR